MKKLLNHNGQLREFEVSYDIHIGDIVYNITHGGGEHPDQFDIEDKAIMEDLHYSTYKPYECRTDLGFGPKENYFKVMKTTGQKVGEFIDALDNGNIIYNENKTGEKEFLFKTEYGYERKGWCSALGTTEHRIIDIVTNPDEWKIFPDFNMNTDEYPYPWSTKWNK